METMAKVKRICNKQSFNTAWKHHVQIYMHVFLMRDDKKERKKQACTIHTYLNYNYTLKRKQVLGTYLYTCVQACMRAISVDHTHTQFAYNY